MTAAEFNNWLMARTAECEQVIAYYLPKEEGYARKVLEAMNYSVRAGGKRLRPMFLLEVARMYHAKEALYQPFMAALEMIHTYSLVHDDLPAMDNDEYRRGRKTTWAVYGEGMAVIAGDALLNYAYETALTAFDGADNEEERSRVIRAMKRLAANAGPSGMVGGQCADIETDQDSTQLDEAMLRYIHEKKTACLIDSGLTIGAILAGAPEDDIDKLAQVAVRVGLAFQIEDDILDVTSTKEVLGKSIGKDAAEGKATYVSMHGLDGAREKAKELTSEALDLMDSLSVQNPFLRELLRQLAERNK